MKRPEGAESLLGQASRWEGGRGVGRKAGPGEVWRDDSEASLAAPSPGRLGARHLGWVDADQRLLLTRCATALYWTKCFSILPDRWLKGKETLARRPARWH